MDRIQEAKRRRLMRKRISGETLSDNVQKVSAAAWVKKLRNSASLKQLGDDNSHGRRNKMQRKNENNNAVKVNHDINDIEAGKTIILTLADSEILSKDGTVNEQNVATLQNSELVETNNISKKNKRNNILHSLYGNEDDDLMNDDSKLLSKYDAEENEKRKNDSTGFMLVGDAGRKLRLNKDVRDSNSNSNNNNNKSDKHGKQRVSLLSDDINGNGNMEMQDVLLKKQKKVKMKKRKHKKKRNKMQSKTTLDDDNDNNVADPIIQSESSSTKSYDDDEEDDSDLFASLARARKLAKKKKLKQNAKEKNNIKKSIEDIATYVAKSRDEKKKHNNVTSTQHLNGGNDGDDVIMKDDNNQDDGNNNIEDKNSNIVSSTTEFTKKINLALLKKNKKDENKLISETTTKTTTMMTVDSDDIGKEGSAYSNKKDQVIFKKPIVVARKGNKKAAYNDVQSILKKEKVIQAKKSSVGAALSLLRDQGEFNDKNVVLVGRKNDTKSGNVFSNVNKPGDRIKLEYRDEQGRLLTPKEAFRQLSYKFHGIEPSKKTKEKRERQLNDRIEKEKSKSHQHAKLKKNANFSSLVRGRFENKIKESKQPFVKLDI
jgi:U4/U6.U5 tri-snRNP-associated protein 1